MNNNKIKIFHGSIYYNNIDYEYNKYVCIIICDELNIYRNDITKYNKINLPKKLIFIDDNKNIIVNYNNGKIIQYKTSILFLEDKIAELNKKITTLSNTTTLMSKINISNLTINGVKSMEKYLTNIMNNLYAKNSQIDIKFKLCDKYEDDLIKITNNIVDLKQKKVYNILIEIYFDMPSTGSGNLNDDNEIIVVFVDNKKNSYQSFVYLYGIESPILYRTINIPNTEYTTYHVKFQLNDLLSFTIKSANIIFS